MKIETNYVTEIKVYSPVKIDLQENKHFFQHKIVIKGKDLITLILNSGSDMVTQIITKNKEDKNQDPKKDKKKN